jgi:hypothetical protein
MNSIKKSLKSFSLIELILVIIVISILLTQIPIKKQETKLYEVVNKLKLYLHYTRYISHIDNKEDTFDDEWKMKFWTLKFQRCKENKGLYFVVYTDKSGGTAHFKKVDTLKDPVNNKYLYSNSDCEVSHDESKYILLTKEYGVKDVQISCNNTSTIGQISFDYEGKVYSGLGSNFKEIVEKCYIDLFGENDKKTITIEPKTGYIY